MLRLVVEMLRGEMVYQGRFEEFFEDLCNVICQGNWSVVSGITFFSRFEYWSDMGKVNSIKWFTSVE